MSTRAQSASISSASWLAGCWVTQAGPNTIDEQWMAPNGGLMMGMSRNVRGGVATSHEFVLLSDHSGTLVYTAMPSGQNRTDFTSTAVSPKMLRFTNPTHDFPQKIEYWRISTDELHAKVYGQADAEESAFELHYRRTDCHVN